MRVLVDGMETIIEGEVIGGELLDGVSGQFDLDATFTVRCDDGACFCIHGWMMEVELLEGSSRRVM